MGIRQHMSGSEYERLMGRPLIRFSLALGPGMLEGRAVLVTGAGGSIGSEVCRMVAKLGLRCRLILVDNSEFNLQAIDAEMGLAGVDRIALFADIRHASDLRPIFRRHHPEFVIHAAALKHVSVCENNITEAVLTNVLGTKTLLDAIGESGVGQALFLSTDKAVNPSTVLGATKGLAEKLWLQAGYPVARLVNVLGSSGSVLPIFRKQAIAREPMTLSGQSMRRYFMAPEEAASALLAALTELSGPEIAIPDVGSPVWISDLARRVAAEAGVTPMLRFVAAGRPRRKPSS
jgi:FlaA1/EpsC-like NDP-sugar epimerase